MKGSKAMRWLIERLIGTRTVTTSFDETNHRLEQSRTERVELERRIEVAESRIHAQSQQETHAG